MKTTVMHLIIVTTSIFSMILCLFPFREVIAGYEVLWILPLTYCIIYILLFIPIIKKRIYNLTVSFYLILSWIRCVLIPLLSSYTGLYNPVSYLSTTRDSIELAILLVAYELIITTGFLFLLTKSHSKKHKVNQIEKSEPLFLGGNKIIYILFILLAVILYITIGRKYQLINFIVLPVGTQEREGDLDSTFLVLIRQIITSAMIFLFLLVTNWSKKKYAYTLKSKYVNLALLVGLLNVGLIVGERRTNQVYTALVVIFILTKTFNKQKKKIILIIATAAITILGFMSIYKHFSGFAFNSYSEAITSSTFDLTFLTETLQSYLFGTQNVATTIEFSKYTNLNLFNIFYDLGRSIFGISFLFKNLGTMTSELFNTFIYGTETSTGHVLSGVGYGYVYFGPLFSPIIVCINLFISSKLEIWFKYTKSYEMKYIVGFMLVRFITNIFSITPPLINLATTMLFTTGLVYYVAKKFKNKTNKIQS